MAGKSNPQFPRMHGVIAGVHLDREWCGHFQAKCRNGLPAIGPSVRSNRDYVERWNSPNSTFVKKQLSDWRVEDLTCAANRLMSAELQVGIGIVSDNLRILGRWNCPPH